MLYQYIGNRWILERSARNVCSLWIGINCKSALSTKDNQRRESMAQYQQSGKAKKTFQSCEVFAMRKALGRAVLPLTILTSNFGVVQGLGRGDVHSTSDKNPNVDAWTIYQTLSKSEKEVGQDSSWL